MKHPKKWSDNIQNRELCREYQILVYWENEREEETNLNEYILYLNTGLYNLQKQILVL